MHRPLLPFARGLLLLLPALCCGAETSVPLDVAWRSTTLNLFKEAHQTFAAEDGPEATLGEALTLLVIQPKTAANVDKAAALLSALAAGSSDLADERAQTALYYLGRIEQVHRQTPDPAAARRHFDRLITAAPAGFWAQQAVVKRALIDLYDQEISEETRRARFDVLVAQAAALAHDGARRDLSLLLADTALQFGYGQDLALTLLLQADAAGVVRKTEVAHVWVRIGELARILGRAGIARDYYERFLKAYPRDGRVLLIRERLAELLAPAPAT